MGCGCAALQLCCGCAALQMACDCFESCIFARSFTLSSAVLDISKNVTVIIKTYHPHAYKQTLLYFSCAFNVG